MLVFVPGYDEPTNSNLQVARKFELESTTFLLNGNATRENLLSKLEQQDSIFIMSHGAKNAVFYEKNKKALVCEDASNLKDKKFFVFACHTATTLGREMANNGNIWWGYTGAISAPDSDEEAADIIKPVFQYILANYSRNEMDNRSNINEVLIRIKSLCDYANEQLDNLNGGDDLNYLEARLCLEHFWNRLRVWYEKEMTEPIKHPDAPNPFLLD